MGHGFFGEHWGVAALEDLQQVPTPVGERCIWCEEAIVEGDRGYLQPCFTAEGWIDRPTHRECQLRAVVGSMAHLQGRCSCAGIIAKGIGYSGPDDDEFQDANQTLREQALEVWEWVSVHGV